MSPNVTLTARQQRAVAALAGGATDELAAKAAHVCRRTVIRWRELPHFAEAVREARERVFEAMLAASEAGAYEAVEQLRELVCVTPKRAASLGRAAELRLSAARALYGGAVRIHEAVTIEERLRALEELSK